MNQAEYNAFVDEFCKLAEEPTYNKMELAQRVAKNVGQGAVGYGLGYGAGHVFDKAILPRLIGRNMSPGRRQLLANTMGAMTGIGSLALKKALNEAQRNVEDVKAV